MSMFGNAFRNFFQNYFNFSGRATRSEFWCVVPVLLVLWILLQVLLIQPVSSEVLGYWGDFVDDNGLYDLVHMIWNCVTLVQTLLVAFLAIPVLSLFSRRVHDAGYSEWRVLALWIMLLLVANMLPSWRVADLLWGVLYFGNIVYCIVLLARPGRNR